MGDVAGKCTVAPVERVGPDFEAVLQLWRDNRATLGLLPRGGFEDCADVGGLLLASVGELPAGYLAFRLTRTEAVIVHVCVGRAFRGQGVASALLQRAFVETSTSGAVRLSCRKDYEQATRLWQRHGFTNVDERTGRGADRAPVLVWRRLNEDDEPLLTRAREQLTQRTVAVDANVFMDFFADDEAAEESKSLTADWLTEDIALCVTAELRNEIARVRDDVVRKERRRQARPFRTLEARSEELEVELARVESVLPPATCDSDESDRRQLAHAVARGAEFFVTRDDTLLGYGEELHSELGISVLRPVDLVRRLYGDVYPGAYNPIRLAGTPVHVGEAGREDDLLLFQGFPQGEAKAEFLSLCRPLLAEPTRFTTSLVGLREQPPFLAYAVEELPDGTIRVPLFRSLQHPLLGTVMRRVLSDLVESRLDGRGAPIVCTDLIDPRFASAARDLGFRSSGRTLSKLSLKGLYRRDDLLDIVEPRPAAETIELERAYWPLKLRDGGVDSFVIPIRPAWAAQLFDSTLASQELFPPAVGPALALENAYYSRSTIDIKRGSRILWYVSGKGPQRVGELRGCSLAEGTVRGSAKDVFGRFRRLGVFQWRDVLRAADGDPHGAITAYHFAFTEQFRSPVGWPRVQEVLREQTRRGNQLAGPVKIPDQVFQTLYEEAIGVRS